jgi:hypothetical protein
VDQSEKLIEWVKEDGKDDVEEMQPTSGTDRPGQKEK